MFWNLRRGLVTPIGPADDTCIVSSRVRGDILLAQRRHATCMQEYSPGTAQHGVRPVTADGAPPHIRQGVRTHPPMDASTTQLLMTENTWRGASRPASAASSGGNAYAGDPGAPTFSAAATASRKCCSSALVRVSPCRTARWDLQCHR